RGTPGRSSRRRGCAARARHGRFRDGALPGPSSGREPSLSEGARLLLVVEPAHSASFRGLLVAIVVYDRVDPLNLLNDPVPKFSHVGIIVPSGEATIVTTRNDAGEVTASRMMFYKHRAATVSEARIRVAILGRVPTDRSPISGTRRTLFQAHRPLSLVFADVLHCSPRIAESHNGSPCACPRAQTSQLRWLDAGNRVNQDEKSDIVDGITIEMGMNEKIR